jgi:predicted nucleotidyltransferase
MIEYQQMPPLLQKHLSIEPAIIAELCRRHGIRELSIFGSVLREDFSPESDVDVLIELEPGQEMSIELYLAIKDDLEGLFGRSVDLVQKHLLSNPYRRYEILRTREVMYAA